MKEQMVMDFEELINYLNLAINNLKNESDIINEQLKKWRINITLDELKNSFNLIFDKVKVWQKKYIETLDILQIGLKEYDLVSKETAYLLDCSMIDELHIEIIDFIIGEIGNKMSCEIRNGGKYHE